MSNHADGSDPSGAGGLGDVFAEVTRDVPPPSFDLNDVTATSARITARRRRAAMGASTLGVVVLGGVLVTTVSFFGQTGGDDTAIAVQDRPSSTANEPKKATPFGTQETPMRPNLAPNEPTDVPDDSPKQGGEAPGQPGPRAGAPRPGCAEADRELALALAGELPAAPVTDPMPADGPCPVGTRAAAYRIDGDGFRGTVSALLVPAGAPELPEPPGSAIGVARTGDGESLVVRSEADSPLDDPLGTDSGAQDIAESVADEF